MAVRIGPWAERKYFLDKMTLRDLVQAYFTHYTIMTYLVLTVVTAGLPEARQLQLSAVPPESPGTATSERLGIKVREFSEQERAELSVEDHGVLVESVKDGAARRAGVRDGDVLLMLNNEKITDVATFRRLAEELPAGKAVSVLVQRQGNPIFMALKTDE